MNRMSAKRIWYFFLPLHRITDVTSMLMAKPRSDAIDVTITTLEGTYYKYFVTSN